jgi:selenocysteine-specific elongation factor
MRVVATAGHVDHGKSTLVQALTGTNPDRFPEERTRGLTIDLGFAFCTLPSGIEVGFVDVPGHTRFIRNMLAGVGAVDVAVLVVAANEGWKPQSEEHLRILDLLDIRHGIVVVTKADLVDAETVELARLEVADHLAGTTFAAVEVVACAARDGEGLDDVRAALDRALAAAPGARDRDRPRLWVDRVFTPKGAGTVVTGTLTGGRIAVDDDLVVRGNRVRVRQIEQHGRAVTDARPGERVALNLAGIDHHEVHRGDAVVRAGQWRAVETTDVALTALPGVALKRRCRLRAAVGSGDHAVWCRRLDDTFARLRFDTPLPLAPGDRLVLRDTGSDSTVAGAEVLDVTPARKAADAPARLAAAPAARLLADGWIPAAGLEARTGLTPDAARALLTDAGAVAVGPWFATPEVVRDTLARLDALVAHHHRDEPADVGVALGAAAQHVGLDEERLSALVASSSDLAVRQGFVHRPDHAGRASESAPGRDLLAALDATPFAPPPVEDRALVRALAREGRVVDLDGVVFSTDALDQARARIVTALADRGSITVADARDLLGSTRKFVVPILGHLDATGVTRRRGDDRIPGPRSGLTGAG